MSDSPKRGFCPRCLLEDAPGGEALARLTAQWIAALPEERRADAATRAARLAACRSCEHLADGLCGLCGCYVEYRAAQQNRRCADTPPKW